MSPSTRQDLFGFLGRLLAVAVLVAFAFTFNAIAPASADNVAGEIVRECALQEDFMLVDSGGWGCFFTGLAPGTYLVTAQITFGSWPNPETFQTRMGWGRNRTDSQRLAQTPVLQPGELMTIGLSDVYTFTDPADGRFEFVGWSVGYTGKIKATTTGRMTPPHKYATAVKITRLGP